MNKVAALIPLLSSVVIEIAIFNWKSWAIIIMGSSEPISFSFSIPRFLIVLAICYSLYFLRPSSQLYRMEIRGSAWVVIVGTVVIYSSAFAVIPFHYSDSGKFEPGYVKYDGAVYDDGQQYAYLANALIDGHVYLDLEVPDYLANMDNPYDANERFRLAREAGQPSYWDYAFYNGKYYCYFGAVPALVLFVPFKLITGDDLPTYVAVSFSAVILCTAIAVFLITLFRMHFPCRKVGEWVLIYMMFAMGCCIHIQVFYPMFYSLPPIWGMVFLLIGLSAWLRANSQRKLNAGYLAIGAACVSLTLGCRPQLFLSVLFAFPLFWKEIVQDRLFFSRKGIANTVAMILPCAIIGALAMLYNHIRFGNPVDFGAEYNLTGFDMTQKKPLELTAIGYALFFYLALPLMAKQTFPYITVSDWSPLPVEPFHGGFLAFNPAVLSTVALPVAWKELKRKRLAGVSVISLLLALVLMGISASMASISMRYMSDFAIFLLVPAACVWLCLLEMPPIPRRYLIIALSILVVLATLLGFFSLLALERYGALISSSPFIYSLLERWFSIL